MSECQGCKGCYDHVWGCTECRHADEHEAEYLREQAASKERARLEAIEAAVAVFGEGARP